MKYFITIFLALLAAGVSHSQAIQADTYLERTHINLKIGTSAGFQFESKIEVGGFFQRATVTEEAEAGRPLRSENEFYGVYFAYPLITTNSLTVKVNVRTGVSNGENFVITPAILTSYQLPGNISFGGGIGVRVFRPTFIAKVRIRLAG